MKGVILAGAFLWLLVPGHVAAQPAPQPIFSAVDAALADRAAGSLTALPKGVADRHLVGMHLDRLFDAAGRVILNLEGRAWTAVFERLDADIQGHRVWVGSIEGIDYSHVSFAERAGVVSGVINGVSETFAVRTIAPGVYAVDRVGPSGRELEPLVPLTPDQALDASAAVVTAAGDDGGVIDVLLLYTPGARNAVGGLAQMNATLAQIISDTNTMFARSSIVTRVRLVGSTEAALPETSNMSDDLTALRNNPSVNALRDSARADLVQLIMNSADTTACGIGYLLNSGFAGNPAAFPAYSISDYSCVHGYTPSHEMGHNMGSHHAPEDYASNALFAYSYGYKNAAAGFRTVMAYNCSFSNCGRILNFSNPAVAHLGVPTGTGTQNNALSINNAAFAVSNMRQSLITATPPSAPTGLASSVSGLSATLSWNPVTADVETGASPATNYILQVGTAPGVYNLLSVPVGNTTMVSGNAPPGTYVWRVIGANSAGLGAPSAEAQFTLGTACTPAGAPLNFTHTVGAGRRVSLGWGPPAAGTGPFAYVIEAGTASGLANILVAPVGGATSVNVVAPPGTYFVRIKTQNACSTSPASTEQMIVVP